MRPRVSLNVLVALATAGAPAVGADPEFSLPAEDRFVLAAHNFVVGGKDAEAYIKLDRFTGRTWMFDAAAEARWKPIPESKGGEAPESGEAVRYEIFANNFSKNGKDQEIYLRFDRQTGKTWRWAGTEPVWSVVEQDD